MNLINEIKERPGLFLGTLSIYTLKAFIDGYKYGVGENEVSANMDAFQRFVSTKYRIEAPVSWDSIIRMYSSSDYQAYTKFFELFEEFIKQNEKE